jgi:hypothetical protein
MPYDKTQLYKHPKRWGEQPHPMNSGLNMDVERHKLRALQARREKQALLQPDKLEVLTS